MQCLLRLFAHAGAAAPDDLLDQDRVETEIVLACTALIGGMALPWLHGVLLAMERAFGPERCLVAIEEMPAAVTLMICSVQRCR